MSKLKIFKEISVGSATKDHLVKQLIEAGIQWNDYAHILIEHPLFSPPNTPEKIILVKVTLSDLDMDNPCSFQEIIKRTSMLGLRFCPLYCAAFLRLAYLDQPEGPYLTVMSDKPENDENHPNGFYLRNINNILWLRGYRATDFCEWPMDNAFIFTKK